MTPQTQGRWWVRWFADDRRFWRMAAAVLGGVSFLRGVRHPSRWAATQAMVNYEFGVVKRGLFGATLGGWLHMEHYGRFALVSFALLSLLVVMLVWMTWRSGALRRLGAGEPVAVFFASFAMTYLAHLVGYLEVPLAVLTIALLLIRSPWVRLAAALPVCVAGILVHEMYFVVFLPAVLFSLLLDGCLQQEAGRRRTLWVMSGALLLVCAAVTFRLGHQRPLTVKQAQAMQSSMAARVDFPVRKDFFDVLTFSSAKSLQGMEDHFLHWGGWRQVFVESVLIFAPTALLLILPGYWLLRGLPGAFRRWIGAAAVAAACAPLAMHLFGFDSARWDALVCVESYLVLVTICWKMPGEGFVLPAGYRNAAVLVIALSMATAETLMDGKEPNAFPFRTPGQAAVHALWPADWTPPEM
jgi:hypothetical protein